ncbi:unnamed protein product [Callosobruchus maculatus]|uniref:Uncharacterized protein n=1 Tax=Callosobruchus maculatus TaxID=64391 RepID=A0A653BKB5_CALMS|nr:unnamed protein product [Callosobruchus maculatus]
MVKSKKLTREDILEKKRIAERARYQRLKSDPTKFAEQCEKEKLKSQKKKEEGKVKLVKDVTPREVSLARKRWRENVAASMKKTKR